MAPASPAPVSPAAQAWHHAIKVRKHLLKQLEKVQTDGSGSIDQAQFEKVDSLLESMRLACVQTIFLDFEYATEEKTESMLWTLHTSVNSEYRRVLGKLKGNSHVVEKRKVEKMYQNFLRIAQKFYKGYVQRLTARYDIPELKRVASGIEVGQLGADDMISPVPEKLNRLVLRSCHATLIRLGDLGRYRVQAKFKKFGSYDTALTYYALAHDLLPESGFGHHQMGIIRLEEGNQFDVVYHFYRAWATIEPHPNAKGNLEAKFKDLRAPNLPAPRQVSATPRDTFSMWFIKLHAFFYKGEAFSQHGELEGEVIHRLDMIAKSSESGDMLLKTVLINIAAFHVAGLKYDDSKKDSALQFARFTMGINARFMTTICDLLAAELIKYARARQSETDGGETSFPAVISQLLPVLRVYMIWLASQRTAIFKGAGATEGLIVAMLRSLGRLLTLLCSEATRHNGLASCEYLLSEDLEIRGVHPLDRAQVPEACRCYCDESGRVKPRAETQNSPGNDRVECLARMLDALRVAYFLAEDATVPLACSVEDGSLVFQYLQGQPCVAAQTNETPYGVEMRPTLNTDASTRLPDTTTTGSLITQPMDSNPQDALQLRSDNSGIRTGDDATNDRTENTVMSMVTPFLRPPTPQSGATASAQSESSYGWHSATAEEVFADLQAKRSPGGTVMPTTFEQLPWNWLHTPTPQKGEKAQQDVFSVHPVNADNSLGIQSLRGHPDTHSQSPLGRRAVSAMQHSRPSSSLRSPVSPIVDEAHRNQLLQSFTGGSSAPRTSSFSHWSPDHAAAKSRHASAASQWGQVTSDAVPVSSYASAFSHPSSLYQGTPSGTMADSMVSSHSQNVSPRGWLNKGNPWQRPTSGDRQLHVDSTTSSYDAAILDGVLKDWK